MEYTLYDNELRWAHKGLGKIKHARNEEVDKPRTLHDGVREMHDAILAVQLDEKAKRNVLKRNGVYVKRLERDKMAVIQHSTKLDLEVMELEDSLGHGKEALEGNKHEL